MVLSESLWFNSSNKIENIPLSPSFCGINKTILLFDLFTVDGKFITWNEASAKLRIQNQVKWIQIMNSIPSEWKKMIRGNHVNRDNCCLDMHLNKNDSIVSLKNLDSKELYSFFLDKIVTTPTSQIHFGRPFGPILNWDKIYFCSHVLLKRLIHSYISI